eukprot:PhF_6_TR11506/c0_g1_i5/m.18387
MINSAATDETAPLVSVTNTRNGSVIQVVGGGGGGGGAIPTPPPERSPEHKLNGSINNSNTNNPYRTGTPSYLQTTLRLTAPFFSTAPLLLPTAMRLGGWVGGIGAILFVCIVQTSVSILFTSSFYNIPRVRVLESLPDMVEA